MVSQAQILRPGRSTADTRVIEGRARRRLERPGSFGDELIVMEGRSIGAASARS
jgi:hypothetical protein